MNRLSSILFAGMLSCTPAVFAGDVEIKDPWVRAVPPSSSATAAFMVIVNKGDRPAALVETSSPVARDVRPMITTKHANGMAGMEFVDSFTIAAGKKRVLEPGADHIMLMKITSVPKAGATVPLTLTFESGGKRQEIRLDAPVR